MGSDEFIFYLAEISEVFNRFDIGTSSSPGSLLHTELLYNNDKYPTYAQLLGKFASSLTVQTAAHT